MKETKIDLTPLKVGDTVYFKPEYGSTFTIEPCTIRKVVSYVDDDGITKFVYKIKTKYGIKQYCYQLDPTELSWSDMYIFTTPQKCMDWLTARYYKRLLSDFECFRKNAVQIDYKKTLQLPEYEKDKC